VASPFTVAGFNYCFIFHFGASKAVPVTG